MSDADERQAAAIILNDLALFNKAAVFFEERVAPRIYEEIAGFVKEWSEAQGWKCADEVTNDLTDVWVHPPEWEEDKEAPLAWFTLERQQDTGNSYQLADMVGVGQTRYGFRFKPDHSWFGGRVAWKNIVKDHSDLLLNLRELGWEHEGNGGYFFLPVELPAEQLAAAWETQNWTEAFAPLEQALGQLLTDQVHFKKFLWKAKARDI